MQNTVSELNTMKPSNINKFCIKLNIKCKSIYCKNVFNTFIDKNTYSENNNVCHRFAQNKETFNVLSKVVFFVSSYCMQLESKVIILHKSYENMLTLFKLITNQAKIYSTKKTKYKP